MSFFNLYNKAKKNLNKSSFSQKNAISFNAYKILKKFVVNGLVQPSALDSAFPKNTKLKVLKNVSQRSMKTFYKLADKHIMNKHGVLSQSNNNHKLNKKLSAKAKELLKLIEGTNKAIEKQSIASENEFNSLLETFILRKYLVDKGKPLVCENNIHILNF